jgi:hypothetical protein
MPYPISNLCAKICSWRCCRAVSLRAMESIQQLVITLVQVEHRRCTSFACNRYPDFPLISICPRQQPIMVMRDITTVQLQPEENITNGQSQLCLAFTQNNISKFSKTYNTSKKNVEL